MAEKTWKSSSAKHTADLAGEVLEACNNHRIFAIYGEMGAGKTTLIKALCAHLGVDEIVKSPTFALVNEYQHREGRIFHFDFYRIVRIEEAYDMGIEEYFGSGEYCFVEWPEKIEDLIPQSACRIDIKWISEDERQITVKVSAASDE